MKQTKAEQLEKLKKAELLELAQKQKEVIEGRKADAEYQADVIIALHDKINGLKEELDASSREVDKLKNELFTQATKISEKINKAEKTMIIKATLLSSAFWLVVMFLFLSF
jgi:hypothetical protein